MSVEEVGLKIFDKSKSKKKFYVVVDKKGQMWFYDDYSEAEETYNFVTAFGIPAKLIKVEVLKENC